MGVAVNITREELTPANIGGVIANCELSEDEMHHLRMFICSYFKDGLPAPVPMTGFPDTAWVVFCDREVVAIHHFYTDCWEGYQDIVLVSKISAHLGLAETSEVQNYIDREFLSREF